MPDHSQPHRVTVDATHAAPYAELGWTVVGEYRGCLRLEAPAPAPAPDRHEPMRLFEPAPNVIPGQLGL